MGREVCVFIMMDFIVEHRWAFLISAEVLFWLLVVAVLVLRYWYRLNKASLITLIILILNDLWIIALGIIDYRQTGQLSIFQFVVAGVILYAVIFGKKDIRRLDAYISRKVAGWKGESVPELAGEGDGKAKGKEWNVKKEFIGLAKHAAAYVVVHAAVIIGLGIYALQTTGLQLDVLQNPQWFMENFSTYKTLNTASNIWTTILTVDVIYTAYRSVFK